MFDSIISFIFFILVFYFFARIFLYASESLNQWSQENNIEIIEKQFRIFRTGPFFYAFNQPVYRLLVRNNKGEEQVCWVRCGNYGGRNPKKIEVKWVENINLGST